MKYLSALDLLHNGLRPRSYVEIGCRKGVSLARARCPSLAIDPDFEITAPLTAPTRLFRETSDVFFAKRDLTALLGGPVDLAFVDGMHRAEFVLRDILNLERHCTLHSVIVVDDVLPEDIAWTTRERQTQAWTGDVYKVIPFLRDHRPDLQIHLVTGIVDDHSRKRHFYKGYSAHVCVLRPESRGRVGLNDANPLSAPMIDPCFLSAQSDADLLLQGTKILRDMMDHPALDDWRGKQLYLNGDEDDATLMAHIRDRADTIYHPVGTCRMGAAGDDMAVVDPTCRVRGIDGLCVVDASVMPRIIGGNTNAPTIMIAEKAADMIRAA